MHGGVLAHASCSTKAAYRAPELCAQTLQGKAWFMQIQGMLWRATLLQAHPVLVLTKVTWQQAGQVQTATVVDSVDLQPHAALKWC